MTAPGLGDRRVALVTGAARGIGAATASALLDQGWYVGAVDRYADDPALPYSLARAEDLEAFVWREPNRIMALEADVRDAAALGEAVAQVEGSWGGLDAAIACAGVIAGGMAAWELPPDQERAVLEVNLGGVLNLARVAIPALLRRPEPRRGRFLATVSAAATRGFPGLAAYGAAKAGVTGFVRSLASDLRGTGVTANTVSPGPTRTAGLKESARFYGLTDAESFARQVPIERLVEPEEIATVFAFLASDEVSAMTGTSVAVDGGHSL
ncbi:MAG TPA: mycofactocin-coupled SDR family oxidoreductase [Acidimicrobiales bacterium]